MEISKKTGLDEGLSKGACEYTYKYFQSNYVSNIPQVIIDFKLNVNYGMSKRKYIEKERIYLWQKAVGILLILLYGTTISDNNQLLILDQPEDDLDNAYVYHTLVKELDRVKEKKTINRCYS